MTEAQFQTKVIKHIESEGGYVVNFLGMNKAGVPDLLVCYDSKFIALELKVGKYKPTALQIRNLHKIKKAGGYAHVFIHSDDWENELTMILYAIYLWSRSTWYERHPLPEMPKGVL